LLTNANERLTAKEALSHPFIKKYTKSDHESKIVLDDNMIRRISSFSNASKIQQLALNFIAH
jgi:hypothetical protein